MLRLTTTTERWALIEPFRIARETMSDVAVIVATLEDKQGHRGRGEAAGVDYDGETPASMTAALAAVADGLDDDLTPQSLAVRMPVGGARNALDCALWDLRSKQTGVRVAQRLGVAPLEPLVTALTIGLGDDASTHRKAMAARGYDVLKVKVDAKRHLDAVAVVRAAHPSARLLVDANQAWSIDLLIELMPSMQAMGVALIEQPLPRGEDEALARIEHHVPIAADESCTGLRSLSVLAGRYDAVNIKLDKCGGLFEALAMLDEAERLGIACMVGNMCGTSLAMAPAFHIGQRCTFVDLDGPLLQRRDRPHAMHFMDGVVQPPLPALWG